MKVKSYTVTCNSCPHQAEGELEDGRWFYFRARHHFWYLSVGDTLDSAVYRNDNEDATAMGVDPHGLLTYGDAPDNARAIVNAIISTLGEAS